MEKQLRIVLLCDNIARGEFSSLVLLKKALQTRLHAKVFILGSIAEPQRIYYLLHKIQPHIVFQSQLQENLCREVAWYVKESGGMICVVPVELSISSDTVDTLINKHLDYNTLFDYFFFPGRQYYDVFRKSASLPNTKLFISGSPKIDVSLKRDAKEFWSRTYLLEQASISKNKRNIFVFTSFRTTSDGYIRKDRAFQGFVQESLEYENKLQELRKTYLKAIAKLCDDFPDCNIIVKVHPLERAEAYEEIKKPNLFVMKHLTIYNCILSIDLAIHWGSTVATECWIQGIPTVQYSPTHAYDNMLPSFSVGNPLYHDYPTLKEGVERYLKHSLEHTYYARQQIYLKRVYSKLDGEASMRIATFLQRKLRKRKFKVRYKRKYSFAIDLFMTLERIAGITVSRQLLSFIKPDYKWKYAVENYLPVSP